MKKCAIIGGKIGKSADDIFAYPDDVEIWAINGIGRNWLPRIDRWFNLHIYERLVAYGYDCRIDRDWSREHPNVPIYVLDAWPKKYSLSKQVILPRASMNRLKNARVNYHCGSFDWLIHFAIFFGIRIIYAHGVGLCLEAGEPLSARACLEYWVGQAEARGIKVIFSHDCDVMHFYHLVKSDLIYGVDDTPIYEDKTKGARPNPPYQL
jgi:hypothetical protein